MDFNKAFNTSAYSSFHTLLELERQLFYIHCACGDSLFNWWFLENHSSKQKIEENDFHLSFKFPWHSTKLVFTRYKYQIEDFLGKPKNIDHVSCLSSRISIIGFSRNSSKFQNLHREEARNFPMPLRLYV